MTDGNLRIEARMQMSGQKLRIEYRATSGSAAPLFLFNILHGEFDNGAFPLDHAAYVELGDGVVIVSRKLFPVPPLTLVEKPNIPFVTRLLPGNTFQEEFSLALPLVPRNPYSRSSGVSEGIVEGRPAVFELGYFVGVEGTEALGKLYPTDAGQRPGFSTFSPAKQRLIRTDALGTVMVSMDQAPA